MRARKVSYSPIFQRWIEMDRDKTRQKCTDATHFQSLDRAIKKGSKTNEDVYSSIPNNEKLFAGPWAPRIGKKIRKE